MTTIDHTDPPDPSLTSKPAGRDGQPMVKRGRRGPPPPKGKGGKPGEPTIITMAQYEAMFDAWNERQNVSHVARVTKLSRTTCTKYLTGRADPKNGMPQIRRRWLAIQTKVQEKVADTLVTARAKNLTYVRLLKSKFAEKLMQKFDVDKLDENRMPASLKDLVLLEERLLGADDVKVNVSVDSKFAGWSIQDIERYINTGREPDPLIKTIHHKNED